MILTNFCNLSFPRFNSLHTGRNRAAVLIPVFKREEVNILFTVRSDSLLEHAGEISLPGGSCEKNDRDIIDTALRETYEEIGIKISSIRIIGVLKNEISYNGKIVTPVIGIIDNYINESTLKINNREVKNLIFVPIRHLLEKSNFWSERWIRNNKFNIIYFYKFEPYIIWGLTGKVIYNFLEKYNKIMRFPNVKNSNVF